jgi:hypothetical protein
MAASTDWVSYYKANHADGGTIEALYAFDDEELAEISKGHNNDAGKLRATIAGSGGGNIVSVPRPKGFVNFLHQGFATATHLGGDVILGFIQGNQCVPIQGHWAPCRRGYPHRPWESCNTW